MLGRLSSLTTAPLAGLSPITALRRTSSTSSQSLTPTTSREGSRDGSESDVEEVFRESKDFCKVSDENRKLALDELRKELDKLENQGNSYARCVQKYKDVHLHRFLKARSYNVSKALSMVLAEVAWREKFGCEGILKEDFADMESTGVAEWYGKDVYGRPVLILRQRFMDHKKWSSAQWIRFCVYVIEKKFRAVEGTSDEIDKITVIFDRHNSTRKNVDMHFYKEIAKTLGDNYPERLGMCLVFPTNRFFYTVWNMCRMFIDPETKAKIHMFGPHYQRQLPKYISRRNMLPRLVDQEASIAYNKVERNKSNKHVSTGRTSPV